VSSKRTLRCICGRVVVLDDATKTIRHQKPECQTFIDGMKRHGMQPKHDPWIEMVRRDGTVIEKGKA
jgi:hypothetical protein